MRALMTYILDGRPVISQDFSGFQDFRIFYKSPFASEREEATKERKKELASIVSKP